MNSQFGTMPGTGLENIYPINNQTSSDYVGGNGSNAISGIVLTNTSGSNSVQTVNFPDSSVRKSYVYYNTALQGLSSSGTMYIWYTNLNTATPNKAVATLTIYVTGGPPSVPQDPLVATPGSDTTIPSDISITYSYGTPEYIDTSNNVLYPDPTNPISNYDISYSSVPSLLRYTTPQFI
jgi:hypothetical protein